MRKFLQGKILIGKIWRENHNIDIIHESYPKLLEKDAKRYDHNVTKMKSCYWEKKRHIKNLYSERIPKYQDLDN